MLLLKISTIYGQEFNASIEILNFGQTECDNSLDPYKLKSRLIRVDFSNDTLEFEVGTLGTCCVDYESKIKFSNDTLFLEYQRKENSPASFCYCCYQFIHKIKGIKNTEITFMLGDQILEISEEKYRTYPISFDMIDGDTINLTDKYGEKQGIWIKDHNRYDVYENGTIVKWGKLYSYGKLKDQRNSRSKKHTEFYESGKKKKECDLDGNKLINCKMWDQDGNIIKE